MIDKSIEEEEQEKLCSQLICMEKYTTKNLSTFSVFDLSIISAALITWGAVSGHLFYYLPKYELVIYPHDDIGFGFINVSDTPEKKNYFALNFLREVGKLDGFISHINHEKF